MNRRVLIPLLSLLLVGGCYLQKNIDRVRLEPAQVEGIEVGKTTVGEAFAILGSPTQSIKLLEHEAYIFDHTVLKRSGLFLLVLTTQRVDEAQNSVTLLVDRHGIVQAVGSRFESETTSFGMPWSE